MPQKKSRKFRKISRAPITVPGYQFAGVHAGIKKKGNLDLALLWSERPARAAAVFTTNRLQAGPIFQGKKVLRGGILQAVVVNSGNANAATGEQGIRDAFRTAKRAAQLLKISPYRILVSSTGKIGVPLEVKKIFRALPRAVNSLRPDQIKKFAHAICTTDRFIKVVQRTGKIQGKNFTVTGIAKGAGMIEPHMATLLVYLMTDLEIALPFLRRKLKESVEQSFNSITVDGDMSTNDTVVMLANGVSGISLRSMSSAGVKKFGAILHEVCRDLALMMVRDGEGATKVAMIHVQGAKSQRSAKKIAYTIARSPLVKTSFFGGDPNWGRVFAALGYSGETFDPSRVDIWYGPIPLVLRGRPTAGRHEALAKKYMENKEFSVTLHLHQGSEAAKVWTSDLTYEYVRINAEYRT